MVKTVSGVLRSGNWKVIVQLKIAYEKEPRFSDKAARSSSLVKLLISLVTTLVDNKNTFEKVADALKKEDEVEGEGLPTFRPTDSRAACFGDDSFFVTKDAAADVMGKAIDII